MERDLRDEQERFDALVDAREQVAALGDILQAFGATEGAEPRTLSVMGALASEIASSVEQVLKHMEGSHE